jgi:hypothetical protein
MFPHNSSSSYSLASLSILLKIFPVKILYISLVAPSRAPHRFILLPLTPRRAHFASCSELPFATLGAQYGYKDSQILGHFFQARIHHDRFTQNKKRQLLIA